MLKSSAVVSVAFCILCSQSFGILGQDREPTCSKFHYEEQLLEKMIRLEIKFETLLDGVKQLETNVKGDMLALKEDRRIEKSEFGQLKADNAEAIDAINAKVIAFRTDQEQKLTRLSTELKEIGNLTAVLSDLKNVNAKPGTFAFEAQKVTERGPSSGTQVVFAETKLNLGGGYSNTTGVFTVPEDGVYLMMVKLCLQDGSYFYFDIMVNGKIQTAGQLSGHPTYYSCHSTHAVVDVKSGYTVWVQSAGRKDSLTLYNGRHHVNSFSGLLIG